MTLKIFIGWSGRRSFIVAQKLVTWLREVIPGVETWMSEEFSPGTVEWFNELNKKLRQVDFAVICVTPENWENTWISYEPGVVIGNINQESRVCPYLIDRQSMRRDLPVPLKYFWAEKASEEGTYRLVKIINEAAGSPLTEKKLRAVFKRKWPKLDEVIASIQWPPPPAPPPDPPEPSDYLDDFANVSRSIELHRDRLYGDFQEIIDRAIRELREGTFDFEAIVQLAIEAIQRSKKRFINEHSLIVGNVCEFFESYFTEEKFRKAAAEMMSALKANKKPDEPRSIEELEALREHWRAYMKIALAEVFSEYHKVLATKLASTLKQVFSRNNKGDT
ncbi:MAG TPA: hypothetical protein VF543_13625 [Pyrinomonadaceae bacterium]|jgi:hypothetical protein